MNDAELIQALEAEFDRSNGFIGQLKDLTFDREAHERFFALLESIDLGHSESLNRRVVELLWMLPLILQWRIEHFREEGLDVSSWDDAVDRAIAALTARSALCGP